MWTNPNIIDPNMIENNDIGRQQHNYWLQKGFQVWMGVRSLDRGQYTRQIFRANPELPW